MWAGILLAALLCVGCGESRQASLKAAFEQAASDYARAESPEDYVRVAAQYQFILDAGLGSSTVWYNQGLAYLQANDGPRAIHALRQAARLRPRDAQIQAALEDALEAAPSSNPAASRQGAFHGLQRTFSLREKLALTTSLAVVALLGHLVSAALRQTATWRRVAMGLLPLVIASGGVTAYDLYDQVFVARGILLRETVTRLGPAELHRPAGTEPLAPGQEVVIQESRGDWTRIVAPSGGSGWVRSRNVWR